jgi:hypothetical protein
VKWLETDVFEFPWYQTLKSDYSLKSTININARPPAKHLLTNGLPPGHAGQANVPQCPGGMGMHAWIWHYILTRF